jgi:hypothetical protein
MNKCVKIVLNYVNDEDKPTQKREHTWYYYRIISLIKNRDYDILESVI